MQPAAQPYPVRPSARAALLSHEASPAAARAVSRPLQRSDEVLLARSHAYILIAGGAVALGWSLLGSVQGAERAPLLLIALLGTSFAAAVSRSPLRELVPAPLVALVTVITIALYTYLGGNPAPAFALLYVVAATSAMWFLPRLQSWMHIAAMGLLFGLAIWLAHTPGEPAWPALSSYDAAVLIAALAALATAGYVTAVVRRPIAEGERRWASIFDTSHDAIVGRDLDGLITLWNRGAERLYGYDASEAMGQPAASLLIPPQQHGAERAILEQVMAAGHGVGDRETERLRRDGTSVTVSLSVTPIYDVDGKVIGTASIARDVTEARRTQEAIRHQAMHDALTDLPNRALFLDRTAVALSERRRDHKGLAVLIIDLDEFKLINDSLGHGTGDELLRVVAHRFSDTVRASDTLARLGGDEFALLSSRLASPATALRLARSLLASLEEPVVLGGERRSVSASIGIACGDHASTPFDLLRDADAALNHAKRMGRGRAELFDKDMRERVLARVRVESALRARLEDGGICVHYQPLIALGSGEVIGAEALARWRHDDWGPVCPSEFIPIAEESGLIVALGDQVLSRVTGDYVRWCAREPFSIAVNVSAKQLLEPEPLLAALRHSAEASPGGSAGWLTVEVTESVLIDRLEVVSSTLEAIAELGIRLALDDFGTGYSSLSYLAHLPFHSVKIDMSIVRDMGGARGLAVARSIVDMGHALGLRVVGEGIETEWQAAALAGIGCDVGQGYLFGRAIAADAFGERVSAPQAVLHAT
jgi:diguanylate cyclase (GGDEF)-like protein/PAS domain S-box-containing protein